MSSPKRIARIAGLLYLIVAIFGAFAFAYVLGKVYVPGDATTTAANCTGKLGTCPHWCSRRPPPGDGLCLCGDDPLPAAQSREQERSRRNGDPRRHRDHHHVSEQRISDCLPGGRNRPILRDRFWRRRFELPGSAHARHAALWLYHRANLFRLVVGATGVSRLQVRDVSKGARRRARDRGHRLPAGRNRDAPGS